MDDATISAVVSEIAPLLLGRAPGKIFQLDWQSLAIDFGLRGDGYLFISLNPARPRIYLIKRRVRDLEKQSLPPGQFSLMLRKELSHTRVTSVDKIPRDRIVLLQFAGADELSRSKQRTLVAQLTGRSANLLLLDQDKGIISQLRTGRGAGQTVYETYSSPSVQQGSSPRIGKAMSAPLASAGGSRQGSVSEQLDDYYTKLANEQAIESKVAAARAELRKEISGRKKLLKQLQDDLAEHGDAEQHKRIGDLLLANVSTAKRQYGRAKLIDYFAEGTPEVEIELDDKITIPEEASRRFAMYSRSKRARKQIASRIETVEAEIGELEQRRAKLQEVDAPTMPSESAPDARPSKARAGAAKRIPGKRRYVSSDGFEILVGRAAKDNDNLTFKIAKPNDLWLHAADYPGSHVIVRNATRKEIPHRTLIEAAQLAAYFSRANKDPKVDVHYTERKFVSKPRGAAFGLVRMSRFKNITVAPSEAGQRVV